MSERLVGFCHSVRFLALLDCSADAVYSINDLSSKTVCHGLLTAGSRIVNEPTESKSLTSLGANVHRNLIGRTAYTSCLNFKNGHNVIECGSERFKSILSRLLLNNLKCVVDDLLCNALLTVEHYVVNKLGYELGIVKRIRQDVSF